MSSAADRLRELNELNELKEQTFAAYPTLRDVWADRERLRGGLDYVGRREREGFLNADEATELRGKILAALRNLDLMPGGDDRAAAWNHLMRAANANQSPCALTADLGQILAEYGTALKREEEHNERTVAADGPALPPKPSQPGSSEKSGFAAAVEQAGLSGKQRQLMEAVAREGNSLALPDAKIIIKGDVLRTLARAKKLLKKVGWHVYRKENRITAEPIKKAVQK
jgi:hypothetical protein